MNNQLNDFKLLIEYAIKAPSGHNTQPWKFKLCKDSIEIHPDYERILPIVDPKNRELFISLGCAAENLCIAATALQYQTKVSINNNGIINIQLNKDDSVLKSPLFEQIDLRQTNKNSYTNQMISESILLQCQPEIEVLKGVNVHFYRKGTARFTEIKNQVLQGNTIQMQDSLFKNELMQWMRFNKKEVEIERDGLSYAIFGAPSLPRCISKRIVRFFLNDKSQNSHDAKKIDSSSHFVLFTSKGDTIESWIETGRKLQRFLLYLTQQKIAYAFLNQPCEITKLSSELKTLLSLNDEHLQILLRIGYAKPTVYSNRRTIEKVLHS